MDNDPHKTQLPNTDTSNPKHVVRTYAGDLAALKNTNTSPNKKDSAEIQPQKIAVPITSKPVDKIVDTPSANVPQPKPNAPVPKVQEKPKEQPEIPVDLVVMRRPRTSEHNSFWSKMWSLFATKDTGVDGKNPTVIHEDIKVSDNEPPAVSGGGDALSKRMRPSTVVQHESPSAQNKSGVPEFKKEYWGQKQEQTQPTQVVPPVVASSVLPAPPPPPPPVQATATQRLNPTQQQSQPATEMKTGIPVPPLGQMPMRAQQDTPPQKNETRENILARLHAKVDKERSANELLVKKSVPSEKREPSSARVSTPTPKESGHVFTPPPSDIPSPLHTYKTDFADHLQNTQASKISVLAAEQDAGQMPIRKNAPRHPYTLIFAITGALLFIIGIGGMLYAYYYHSSLSAPVATKQVAPSLIATDGAEQLSGTGIVLMQALASAATRSSLTNGSMKLVYTTIATTTQNGATTTVAVPGGYLIAALKLPIPGLLTNTIAADSTVGIVHVGSQSRPFFLLHIASYDNAFAGMLQWESTIATDLAPIYPPYPTMPTIIATSTATSTNVVATSTAVVPDIAATNTATSTQVSNNAAAAGIFVDEIIANHDVRILHDTYGRSIMLYGFRNKHTLIIARDPAAFTTILNRLNNTHAK